MHYSKVKVDAAPKIVNAYARVVGGPRPYIWIGSDEPGVGMLVTMEPRALKAIYGHLLKARKAKR